MKTRHLLAALCALISFLLAVPALAAADPTVVNVRIEGATETLFEGPLAVEPHGVLASSDANPTPRPCAGIDALDPASVPAPTPTASAAAALDLIGETFDGKWYDGFNDYFITRFGPDAEAGGKSWGVLVNNTFTSVGGCQYRLDAGDEVLWIYNAFDSRPNLALYPESETGDGRPLTATATLNEPFGVEVVAFADNQEDIPSDHPGREGSALFPDAYVSPVTTAANGFEHVDTADPATVVTDGEGKARITFATPGWHRIKATVPGADQEEAIRSNRLDVCVPAAGQSDCGAPPAEDRVRGLPSPDDEGEAPGDGETPGDGSSTGEKTSAPGSSNGGDPSPAAGSSSQPGTTAPQPGPPRAAAPKLDRAKLRQGRLKVSWKVLDPGAGVRRWTISSRTLGAKQARYVKRARGTGGTTASLRLPRGHAYRLRLTLIDAGGRTSTLALGKVVVPGGRRN